MRLAALFALSLPNHRHLLQHFDSSHWLWLNYSAGDPRCTMGSEPPNTDQGQTSLTFRPIFPCCCPRTLDIILLFPFITDDPLVIKWYIASRDASERVVSAAAEVGKRIASILWWVIKLQARRVLSFLLDVHSGHVAGPGALLRSTTNLWMIP